MDSSTIPNASIHFPDFLQINNCASFKRIYLYIRKIFAQSIGRAPLWLHLSLTTHTFATHTLKKKPMHINISKRHDTLSLKYIFIYTHTQHKYISAALEQGRLHYSSSPNVYIYMYEHSSQSVSSNMKGGWYGVGWCAMTPGTWCDFINRNTPSHQSGAWMYYCICIFRPCLIVSAHIYI